MTIISQLEIVLQQEAVRHESDETYQALKQYYETMKAQGLLREEGYVLAPFGEPVNPPPQKYKIAAKTIF
jgi:hypothetical protein